MTLLCKLVGPFLVQCHGATPEPIREVHGMKPGDLLVCIPGVPNSGCLVRGADRRALAEAIAPPGALIGTPEEIAPLLEPAGGA